MGRDIERQTGIPVVSITYDGTGSTKNDAIVPYLQLAQTLRTRTPDTGGPGECC